MYLLVDRKRIELLPSPCKGDVLPLSLTAHLKQLVRVVWFEHTISCSQSRRNNQTILHSVKTLVPPVWIEQTVTDYKTVGLPLTDEGKTLGWLMRFELTLYGLTIRGTAIVLQSPLNLAVPTGVEPVPAAWQAAILTDILWNHIETHWCLGVYMIGRPAGSSIFNSPLNSVQSPTQCASIWSRMMVTIHPPSPYQDAALPLS